MLRLLKTLLVTMLLSTAVAAFADDDNGDDDHHHGDDHRGESYVSAPEMNGTLAAQALGVVACIGFMASKRSTKKTSE